MAQLGQLRHRQELSVPGNMLYVRSTHRQKKVKLYLGKSIGMSFPVLGVIYTGAVARFVCFEVMVETEEEETITVGEALNRFLNSSEYQVLRRRLK